MLIYKVKNNNNEVHVILHFGIGLVGNAIKNSICRLYQPQQIQHISFSWNQQTAALECLEHIFEKTTQLIDNEHAQLHIVWSAGKCGFGATTEETQREQQLFYAVIDRIDAFAQTLPTRRVYFYLMSSAGGLYENQSHVNTYSSPAPQRPYGFLKLEQEKYILKKQHVETKIFRISSVYSRYLPEGRKGLMAVMMNNCIQHKVSTIFGSANTLRDYVLDEDIGDYVTKCIFSPDNDAPQIQFLIAGQPSSILEIKKYIEVISKKKSYVNYTLVKSNASNICFSPKLVPSEFHPSSLYLNLQLLYLNILGNKTSKNYKNR